MTSHHTEGRCEHNEAEGTAAAVLLVAAAEAGDQHALAHAMCLVRTFACPAVAVPLVAGNAAAKVLQHGQPCTAGAVTFLQDGGVWTFTLDPAHLILEREVAERAGLTVGDTQGEMWTLAARSILAMINNDAEQMRALWIATELPVTPALTLLASIGAALTDEAL